MKNINGYEEFKQIITDNKKYILLFFTASWCGPCKKIYPSLEELYKNLNTDLIEIYKIQIDDDDNEEICKIYKVESVPSFFLMKDKQCINSLKGADMTGIKKMLNIKD